MQATNICEVDKSTYQELCEHLIWVDPPKFGRCVPTQHGSKKGNEQDPTPPAHPPPIPPLKLRRGYRNPKKVHNTQTTPASIEDGELLTSDDEMPTPQVASKICRAKRPRSESPAKELKKAIELLEKADELKQQARSLREEAREIRQRYDKYKR